MLLFCVEHGKKNVWCMMLFFCKECYNIVKMYYDLGYCKCRKTACRYLKGGDNVEISGDASCLGILNSKFLLALANEKTVAEEDRNFVSFVFHPEYKKIKWLDKDKR